MALFKKKTPDQRQESTRQGQKLLSARTRKYIGKCIKLGQLVACHPFEWNEKEQRPEFTTSRRRLLAWFFNVAFCTAYLAFVVVQCIRSNMSDDVEKSTKIFMSFATCFYSLTFFFNVAYLKTWKELPEFVSSYFSYCDEFEDKFVRADAKQTKISKLSGLFTLYTYYAFSTDGICIFGFGGLTRLDGPEQLSSLFPGWPVLQVFTSVICNVYYGISLLANGQVIVLTTFPALFVFFDILEELTKDKSDFTNEAFRRPRERVQVYRVILLYADATDRVYGFIHATSKYILMFNGMLCAYGAIRFGGLVSITLAILGISLTANLMAFLNGWAKFYSGSTDVLRTLVNMTTSPEHLENERARAWLRRAIKSLQVARLPIGGMYYIDRSLVMSVINTINDGMIFLLVNY